MSWLPESDLRAITLITMEYLHIHTSILSFLYFALFPQSPPTVENRCLPDCSCETLIPIINVFLVSGHQQQCLEWERKLKGKQNLVLLCGIPCQGNNSANSRATTTELNSVLYADFHCFLSQTEKFTIGIGRSQRLNGTVQLPALPIPSKHTLVSQNELSSMEVDSSQQILKEFSPTFQTATRGPSTTTSYRS